MFAHYNAWANDRLYETAARLSGEQYRADRGAFFKSVHGTLNHLLVTDRIWMQRFTGEGDAPNRLDAILFEAFDELRVARAAEGRASRARPRAGESCVSWRGWTTGASKAPSNTAGSPLRRNSSRHWRRRWRTGSITRPTTAGKFMRY
jgi:hypothetical protein